MAHRVFISHHHENDQYYKDRLVQFGEECNIFVDGSVDTGDIDDTLPDERIREIIRDEYLRDSSVTIVLVGTETKKRKHIDWEIYSSMIDGQKNKKSGILVINLPSADKGSVLAPHGIEEQKRVYPERREWNYLHGRSECEQWFPYLPSRILDSLVKGVKISITRWDVLDLQKLKFLIDTAYKARRSCAYDLSAPMRRHNS